MTVAMSRVSVHQAASMAILKNQHAIAVSQDVLGQMGIRLSNNSARQVWARKLANGDVAVALCAAGLHHV